MPGADGAVPGSVPSVPVLLLRHGQSEWNAVRRWQGTADSPLTALGREQAIETAWALAGLDTSFTSVWSSDLSRARETAAIIADALAVDAPRIDPRLREAYAGQWEGMTPDEIEAGWPGWLDAHRRPESFEPFHTVVERVLAVLRMIADDIAGAGARRAALVVAHSGVIRALIRHLGDADERVPNLGGIWLSIDVSTAPHSITHDSGAGISLHDVFDPTGIVVSGIDAPGEDPGDEADQADAYGRAQH